MNLVEQVKSEISKENPDWLLISNLSKQIAAENLPTCPIGFKKGYINFIKVREYSSFTNEFVKNLDRSQYRIRYINYTRKAGSIIKETNLDDKFTIFISHKDITSSVSFPMDIPFQRFNGSCSYSEKNYYTLRNNQTKERITFKSGELKSIIRDRKLSLLDI